jgi:predicted DsbA family dithiol-disulfide isomerase
MNLIRAIYYAFWHEGKDISDQSVLDQLCATLPDSGSDDAIARLTGEWEAAWQQTGQAGVPLIVSPAEELLVGCVAPEALRRFFS